MRRAFRSVSFLSLALLSGLALALYLPYIDNPLAFDSLRWFSTEKLAVLRNPENTHRLLSRLWAAGLYDLFDGDTRSLNFMAFLTHALAGYCGFIFFRNLLARFELHWNVGLCAAAILVLHPVSVYAVAYLGQQELVLATAFCFLSLNTYLHALDKRSAGLFRLSALFYLCAMLSKETAVMLPVVVAVMSLSSVKVTPGTLRLQLEPAVWFTVIAVYFLAVQSGLLGPEFKVQRNVGQAYEASVLQLLPHETVQRILGDAATFHWRSVLTQCTAYFHYLGLMVAPLPSLMSIDVQLPLAKPGPGFAALWGLVLYALYGAVVLLLVIQRGRPALLGFCLAWPWAFFATELVAVRLSETFVIYRSYLWLPGIALLMAWTASNIFGKWFGPASLLGMALLFVLAQNRLDTFKQPVVLWDDAVRKNQPWESRALSAYRPYVNRGFYRGEGGDDEGAIEDYNHALAMVGDVGVIYLNRGISRARLGMLGPALADLERAAELSADYPLSTRAVIAANRANALMLMGDKSGALKAMDEALRHQPDSAEYQQMRRRMETATRVIPPQNHRAIENAP